MRPLILLAALVLVCDSAKGQARLDYAVISSGAAAISGPGYRLVATAGDPLAGIAAGLRSGFWFGGPMTVTSAEPEAGGLPDRFELHQAYPNPFNPAAVIRYDMPAAAHVRLAVYDLLGREVALLVDERRPPGRHAASFGGHALASGLYVYVIEMGDFRASRKMLLVK